AAREGRPFRLRRAADRRAVTTSRHGFEALSGQAGSSARGALPCAARRKYRKDSRGWARPHLATPCVPEGIGRETTNPEEDGRSGCRPRGRDYSEECPEGRGRPGLGETAGLDPRWRSLPVATRIRRYLPIALARGVRPHHPVRAGRPFDGGKHPAAVPLSQ